MRLSKLAYSLLFYYIFILLGLGHHLSAPLSLSQLLFLIWNFPKLNTKDNNPNWELSEWPVLHIYSSAFRTQLRGDPFPTTFSGLDPVSLGVPKVPCLLSSLIGCIVLKPPPVHLLCTYYSVGKLSQQSGESWLTSRLWLASCSLPTTDLFQHILYHCAWNMSVS